MDENVKIKFTLTSNMVKKISYTPKSSRKNTRENRKSRFYRRLTKGKNYTEIIAPSNSHKTNQTLFFLLSSKSREKKSCLNTGARIFLAPVYGIRLSREKKRLAHSLELLVSCIIPSCYQRTKPFRTIFKTNSKNEITALSKPLLQRQKGRIFLVCMLLLIAKWHNGVEMHVHK